MTEEAKAPEEQPKDVTRADLIGELDCEICGRKKKPGIAYDRDGKVFARFCHQCIFTLVRWHNRMQKEHEEKLRKRGKSKIYRRQGPRVTLD